MFAVSNLYVVSTSEENTHPVLYGYYATAYSSSSSDKFFVLVSPTIHPGTYCLSFWYRVDTDDGVFKIRMTSRSTGLTQEFKRYLNTYVSTSRWSYAQINAVAQESAEIAFEVKFSQPGYMDIDDLSLSCGECTRHVLQMRANLMISKSNDGVFAKVPLSLFSTDQSLVINGTMCTGTSGLDQTDCTFEHGTCGWTLFNWKRTTGIAEDGSTAPLLDHTLHGEDGHFSYMESDSSRAELKSPTVPPSVYCFSFWYHMNGDDPGQLELTMYEYRGGFNSTVNVFTKYGNHGDEWRPVNIQMNSTQNFTLFLIGVRNGTSSGGIAVDDLNVCLGQCKTDSAFIDWYQPLASSRGKVINLSEVGVIVNGTTAIIFEVKSGSGVRILLQDNGNTTIEVALGIQNNTLSGIAHKVKDGLIAKHLENNIVTSSAYRAFWISWDDGTVRVGKSFVPKTRELMHLNESHDFTSMSVELSDHSDGYWKFYKDKFPRATTTSNPTSSVSHAVPSTQSSTMNVQTTSTQLSTASAITPGVNTTSGLTSSLRTGHTTNSTEKTEENPLDEMPASGNGLVVAAVVAASFLEAVIVAIIVLIIWRKNYGTRMTHCWNKNADRKVESTVAENYTYANTGTVLSAVNGQLQHSNDREYVNFGVDIQEGNTESSFIAINSKSKNDEEAYNHLQAIKHPDNTDAEYSHLQSSYQGYSGGNDKTYAHTNGIKTNQSDPFLKNENDKTYNTVHLVRPSNKKEKGKMKKDEDATYDHATTKRNMEKIFTEDEYSHLERPTKSKNSNTST